MIFSTKLLHISSLNFSYFRIYHSISLISEYHHIHNKLYTIFSRHQIITLYQDLSGNLLQKKVNNSVIGSHNLYKDTCKYQNTLIKMSMRIFWKNANKAFSKQTSKLILNQFQDSVKRILSNCKRFFNKLKNNIQCMETICMQFNVWKLLIYIFYSQRLYLQLSYLMYTASTNGCIDI